MSLLLVFVALATGNFFWQGMQGQPNWNVAAERSYFQAGAILSVFVFNWIRQKMLEE